MVAAMVEAVVMEAAVLAAMVGTVVVEVAVGLVFPYGGVVRPIVQVLGVVFPYGGVVRR